jgi:uncharacterized membrane protein YjgN (DUF898 family)
MNDMNTVTMADHTGPQFQDTVPSRPFVPRAGRELEIRFTGSGSEYFRIWIVNLLLTLVTLGVYYPWAKVRRLRYFYGNTLVDDHPLDFHGEPLKMLRGYLLVGVMIAAYSLAGHVSPTAGLAALLFVAALWPALLRSSMRFRLANTSWRGLRFRFNGSLGGAYRAMLPLFMPALAILAPITVMDNPDVPPTWFGLWTLGVLAAMVLAGPWLWWNLKKYQHDHYAFGQWQTRLEASLGSFYAVFLKTFGVFLAMFAVLLISIAATAGLGAVNRGGAGGVAAILIGLLAAVIALFAVQFVPRPYFMSRMQNLLWSHTGSREMRFRSSLGFRPLLRLTVKNWLLVVLTLGLYWPFAAVATQRLRAQAVSVKTSADPDDLVDRAGRDSPGAAGDAAGDLFGLDIGF